MIRLIVTADDLGAGSLRDRGIFQAFTDGLVTGASLLANGPSFAAAACEARALRLPVGVHLNLAEGRPLAGPLPGLSGPDGAFAGKAATRAALAAGRVDPAGLRRELVAQVERVLAAGLAPDHLDTHQHTFLYPAVAAAVCETARAFGIGAVRLPAPAEPPAADPPGALGEELALYRRLAPAARKTIRGAGLATPDGLWGMPRLGRLDEESLLGLLAGLPEGTWELMVHPGHRDPADPFGGIERERERAALTSPATRALTAGRGILPTTFGELACAS
jgi:predicted glycoside hydrolase/deacetylase ChbG (UPF0249 family)